jgi:hypothetical protein
MVDGVIFHRDNSGARFDEGGKQWNKAMKYF